MPEFFLFAIERIEIVKSSPTSPFSAGNVGTQVPDDVVPMAVHSFLPIHADQYLSGSEGRVVAAWKLCDNIVLFRAGFFSDGRFEGRCRNHKSEENFYLNISNKILGVSRFRTVRNSHHTVF